MKKTVEIINELRAYESKREWFEFKLNWSNAKEIGEYISALANSAAYEGRKNGYLVWGINNKTHGVEGTTFNPNSEVKGEPLKHFLARQLYPENNFNFDETVIDGKRVVLLTIPAAKISPLSFNDERFIRIGSSKEKIRKYPEKESFLFQILRTGFPTMENTPSDFQDLTFEKLFMYYGAKGLPLNRTTFKRNLGLLTEDGKYNILAQLLSDDSHMSIRVALFSGKTKADMMFAVREFGNQCLLYTLDDILRYGDVLNVMQADERDRVVERKEVPLFESDAFREAVINAFVHNAWVTKNEPMITVFSDRIEILSRGTLAPEQTMEGFYSGVSVPVNKKLSDLFLQLHISERTGRGVPTIVKAYGKKAYEFLENAIVVKIPFNWINVMGERSGSKNKQKPLSKTQQKILTLIKENPSITKALVAEALYLGKTTVDNGFSVLKDSGYIERVGSRKKGYYKILKDD